MCADGGMVDDEPGTAARRRWLGLLARGAPATLDSYWQAMAGRPEYQVLRGPEAGLVMLEGRAGGAGQRFNMGEMSITRCSVRLDSGAVGHGYVAGRDGGHAELVALFDALLQDETRRPAIERDLLTPLADAARAWRQITQAKTAATKVDFMTLVRGEDE